MGDPPALVGDSRTLEEFQQGQRLVEQQCSGRSVALPFMLWLKSEGCAAIIEANPNATIAQFGWLAGDAWRDVIPATRDVFTALALVSDVDEPETRDADIINPEKASLQPLRRNGAFNPWQPKHRISHYPGPPGLAR
jgi:hypothetical protein